MGLSLQHPLRGWLTIRRFDVCLAAAEGKRRACFLSESLDSERSSMFPGFENRVHRLFDGEVRVVQEHRIFCRLQGRDAAASIPRITRLQVGAKTVDISRNTL